MNSDIIRAKEMLIESGYTCVLVKGDSVYTSEERGVKPLMSWLDEGIDLKGYSAADKVVGRATAFLYVLLGIKAVYAGVISTPAFEVLKKHGVDVSFNEQVEAIRNRTNTGFCPMEQATQNVTRPQDAPAAIRAKLQELKRQ